jgi:hypothetical protein
VEGQGTRAAREQQITGHSDGNDIARWLADLDDRTCVKLAAVELIEPRVGMRATLAFIDGYIASRTNLKERTILNLKQARRSLVERFGARLLATIKRVIALRPGSGSGPWRRSWRRRSTLRRPGSSSPRPSTES